MAYNKNTLPGAVGSGRTEDAYESGRVAGIAPATGLGLGQTQPQGMMKGGLTGSAGEVCDAPGVYNTANATKTIHHVNDDHRERQYEAVQVEETIVHHDIERVKPVLHQEVHQTRLHEVTHHKVEPVRDLGVVEVVHHRDTDACGNIINPADFNAIRGVGHQGGIIENIKDKLTGTHTTTGTSGYKSDTVLVPTGLAVMVTKTIDDETHKTIDTKVNPLPNKTQTTVSPLPTTAHTTTVPMVNKTHGTTATTADAHKPAPGGIKGLINKVIPGPGPF